MWLEVLNENSVVTLKKLFEDQTDVWMTKDSSMCSNCGQNCIKEEMYSISSTNNLLIISLGLWKEVNNQIKKKVISLKNVPKDTITVSGHQIQDNCSNVPSWSQYAKRTLHCHVKEK